MTAPLWHLSLPSSPDQQYVISIHLFLHIAPFVLDVDLPGEKRHGVSPLDKDSQTCARE